jgi:hypothetical protein
MFMDRIDSSLSMLWEGISLWVDSDHQAHRSILPILWRDCFSLCPRHIQSFLSFPHIFVIIEEMMTFVPGSNQPTATAGESAAAAAEDCGGAHDQQQQQLWGRRPGGYGGQEHLWGAAIDRWSSLGPRNIFPVTTTTPTHVNDTDILGKCMYYTAHRVEIILAKLHVIRERIWKSPLPFSLGLLVSLGPFWKKVFLIRSQTVANISLKTLMNTAEKTGADWDWWRRVVLQVFIKLCWCHFMLWVERLKGETASH